MGADGRAGLFSTGTSCTHTTSPAAGSGFAALGAPAVSWIPDPGELRVTPDHGVVTVHEDYLVIFQLSVLANPVGVQYFHVGEPA